MPATSYQPIHHVHAYAVLARLDLAIVEVDFAEGAVVAGRTPANVAVDFVNAFVFRRAWVAGAFVTFDNAPFACQVVAGDLESSVKTAYYSQ